MSLGQVLVVDDEKLIRWSLKECLTDAGYEVDDVDCAAAALAALRAKSYDAVLLDFKLPDHTGIEVLKVMKEEGLDDPVVMITAHSSVENSIEAIQAGAVDYVGKPFRNEDILLRTARVVEMRRLHHELDRLRSRETRTHGLDNVIGESPAMQRVFRLVERIVASGDTTILIQGESGTGKDVLARAIHCGGQRTSGPFMNITCTALPDSLLESELFGHEKGAFTDAKSQKKGLVELAGGGTLFLDEIGDMSGYLQAKLLRFLEEKRFRRVGGTSDISVDVRVIAATNRDLRKLLDRGEFREDLYFRLNVIPIHLPPLREREGDIPLLVQHFIERYNREFKKSVKGLDPKLLKRFVAYGWPGNVRELRNAIERAMILGVGEVLRAEDIPLDLFDDDDRAAGRGTAIKLTNAGLCFENLERDLVAQALRLARGNQTRAGKLLSLNRDQIRYRVEKFGLEELKQPVDDD